MKKSLYALLLLVIVVPVIWVCASGNDPETELKLDSNIYTVSAGENTSIDILQGYGNYDLTCGNDDIVLAGYTRTGKSSPGTLVLTGVNPGRTSVTITDKATGEEVHIEVLVTEEPREQ